MSTCTIEDQVREFLELLYEPGDVFEVRAPKSLERPGSSFEATWSGYYDDIDKATADILELDAGGVCPAIYCTLNPVRESLLARAHNRLIFKAKTTTTDRDIVRRRWLLVDCDPCRPAGVSSTEAELEAARLRAEQIKADHDEQAVPIMLMSGNGYHLLYRIDEKTDDGGRVKFKLESLDKKYSDDEVHIDTGVFNAARITKIPGTMACKGEDFEGTATTPPRPHRRAAITYKPGEEVKQHPLILPDQDEKPLEPRSSSKVPATQNHDGPRFEKFESTPAGVQSYLEGRGVSVGRVQQKGTAAYLMLDACPVDPSCTSESSSDIAVVVGTSGGIGYKNLHNRGQGIGWLDVRDALEPGYKKWVEGRGWERGTRAHTSPQAASGAPRGSRPQHHHETPHTASERLDVVRLFEVGVLQAIARFDIDNDKEADALAEVHELLAEVGFVATRTTREVIDEVLREHGTIDAKLYDAAGRGRDVVEAELLFEADPPTPAAVVGYARHLQGHHLKQRAERLRDDIVEVLHDGDPQKAIERAAELALDAVEVKSGKSGGTIGDDLAGFEAWLESQHGKDMLGIPTGTLPTLDEALDGLRGFMLIAAEPGCGKTTLGLQFGLDAVQTADAGVCFIVMSYEMSKRVMMARLMQKLTGLDYRTLTKGDGARGGTTTGLHFKPTTRNAYDDGLRRLRQLGHRLTVLDLAGQETSYSFMRTAIERAKRRAGCSRAVVLLDTLQHLNMPTPEGRRFASEIERDNHNIGQLLRLSHKLPDDALVVITEQNKEGMGKAGYGSTRGTARAVYAPDVVAFLQAPSEQKINEGTAQNRRDFVIVKGRDGVTRKPIPLDFKYHEGRFVEDSGSPYLDNEGGAIE